jgi:hypothetical protein
VFDYNHKEFISIDETYHTLLTQGELWYRGVYHLEQKEGRTRIILQVYNVAERQRWADLLSLHKFENLSATLNINMMFFSSFVFNCVQRFIYKMCRV